MPDHPPLRRPSDDLGELREQLLRELDGISRHGDSWGEPSLFRAYLQHAQALAWQGVADGALNAPRDVLDHLLSAQPFVDRHAPRPPGLAAQAAQEVHQAIRSLYLADQALEEARSRARLADRDRSRTEREILRILFENRGTYLRRGAVRSRMDPADRPTPARVGQILVELYGEGLVLRTHGRAQGSPSAAFYALSPFGFEVCRSLGLDDVKSKNAWIARVLEKIASPQSTPEQRKMMIAFLSTCSSSTSGDLVIEHLEKRIRQEQDESRVGLFKEILIAVFLARRKIDFGAIPASGPEGTTSRAEPGLYLIKGQKESLPTDRIIDAFIAELEQSIRPAAGSAMEQPAQARWSVELAQDGLIEVLRKERDHLTSERLPALASHG